MDKEKLEFKIVEIPEGSSERTLGLDREDLDLGDYPFLGGSIDLSFYRTLHFIRVDFTVDSDIELVCDRSLEPFEYPIKADYEVLFKVDVKEETETEEGAVRRFNFSSNTLNIEEEVRDTILLNIPIKKLHPKYLDEQGNPRDFQEKSFGDLKEEEEDSELADPRWEKLKKLKDN
ncbi:YceD family protein [Halalkalibaculum sp. DA3122]|uniref:YceD family protein n=1 Tax=unclassified Halalkalibaculum TaxID=2964617 RepID=UPI0037551468